mmetsp:Transcript_18924/g.62053  ORF Transcript_18924/g.62053 Transcript_18924/m.62053 type:complete len:457 (+) Transcript_18924:573-1943(+)
MRGDVVDGRGGPGRGRPAGRLRGADHALRRRGRPAEFGGKRRRRLRQGAALRVHRLGRHRAAGRHRVRPLRLRAQRRRFGVSVDRDGRVRASSGRVRVETRREAGLRGRGGRDGRQPLLHRRRRRRRRGGVGRRAVDAVARDGPGHAGGRVEPLRRAQGRRRGRRPALAARRRAPRRARAAARRRLPRVRRDRGRGLRVRHEFLIRLRHAAVGRHAVPLRRRAHGRVCGRGAVPALRRRPAAGLRVADADRDGAGALRGALRVLRAVGRLRGAARPGAARGAAPRRHLRPVLHVGRVVRQGAAAGDLGDAGAGPVLGGVHGRQRPRRGARRRRREALRLPQDVPRLRGHVRRGGDRVLVHARRRRRRRRAAAAAPVRGGGGGRRRRKLPHRRGRRRRRRRHRPPEPEPPRVRLRRGRLRRRRLRRLRRLRVRGRRLTLSASFGYDGGGYGDYDDYA